MAQDYTNMSVQDKLRLADERLEKLKGTDKYEAFKERVDAMHAKYGSVPEAYTWATQKLNNKVAAYEFDAKAHGRVDKNGEADFQKDPLPMLDEWVVLDHGSDKYGISERGLMTRPIPKFFTQPTKPPSPDELADSYRKATKPLDYLRLKRGGTVDELAASFKVMKRGLGTTQAAKGGEAPDLTGMSNFLATDKVPDTIFGIPVVSRREDYTEEDIAFFKEHPEAGGYYDMGEGTPEDGTPEGEPTQLDMPVMLGMAVGVNGAWNYRKATGKHLGDYAAFRKAAVPYAKLTDLDFKTKLGANSKKIRDLLRTTKWQYGPGGDPMYETASDPTFRPSFLKAYRIDANTAKEQNKALATLYGNTQTTAGEMLDLESSGLSKMYPALASMRVRFAPQPTDGEKKNWQGSFNFVGKVPEITIYPRGHNSSEQIRSTILHEIQHYIQHVEGWAPGGSIEKAGSYDNYYRLTGEVGSRITQDRMNLKPEDRIRNPLWKSSDKIMKGKDIDLRTAEGQKTVADARATKAREEAEAKERAKERVKDRERRAKAREDYYRRAKKGAK